VSKSSLCSALPKRSYGFCLLSVLGIIGVATLILVPAGGRSSAHAAGSQSRPAVASTTPEGRERLKTVLAALPLAFEQNEGQVDPQVKYFARANGYKLFLTSSDAVLSFASPSTARVSRPRQMMEQRFISRSRIAHKLSTPSTNGTPASYAVLRMHLVNGNAAAKVEGGDLLAGKTNYFIGNDPRNWHRDVKSFGRVSYSGVYPGVDLVYHGQQRQLEFDFVVAPDAKAEDIALSFTGAQRMTVNKVGDLVIESSAGEVDLHHPVAYQQDGHGREIVESRFVLDANNRVHFSLGNYDRSRRLVIDPGLSFASYVGGNGDDEGYGVAMDNTSTPSDIYSNTYITGESDSTGGFPLESLPSTFTGYDAFVTKINSEGQVVYTTFVGSSGADSLGSAIALSDSATPSAYVAGITDATDFPTTSGVVEPSRPASEPKDCSVSTMSGPSPCTDGFVFQLNSSGAVSYATYLGGSNDDGAFGIAVDGSGNAYVTGLTFSSDFPLSASPLYPELNLGVASNPPFEDAFVSVLNPTATAFVYSTYLGGANNDSGSAITVDSTGAAYVTGTTYSGGGASTAFPTTADAYQTLCGGAAPGNCDASGQFIYSDVFITKIAPGGTSLSYSTFLGGGSDDVGISISLDGSDNIYVTGQTSYDNTNFPDDNFPTTAGSFEPNYGGVGSGNNSAFSNAFVSEIKPAGGGLSDLVYSSYLGGSNEDAGLGIVSDSAGDVYVTGGTLSTDFPTANAFQTSLNGNSDAFVTEVAAGGATLVYSSYLGGSGDENYNSAITDQSFLGGAVALDSLNNVYLAGSTSSVTQFPLANALEPQYGGGPFDAFAAIVTPLPDFVISNNGLTPAFVNPGSSATTTLTIASVNSFTGSVGLSCQVVQPTNATSPPTCSFSSSTVTGGSGKSTLTVNTTASTSLAVYVIDVIGAGPTSKHAVPVTLNVQNISFTLSASPLSSVTPGNSSTSTVTLSTTNQYDFPVKLSCSVSGTGSPAPACGSFSPASPLTPTSNGVTTTLTITTTGSSSSSGALVRPTKYFYAMWLPIAGLSMLGLSFSSARSRRKKVLGFLAVAMVMTALFLLPACGKASNATNTNTNTGGGGCTGCTPTGNYTVTITGTGTDAQQVTQSTTLTLTVN